MATIDQINQLKIEETQLDLFQALTYLENENQRVLIEGTKGHCRIRISDRKGVCLLEKILEFPLVEEIEDILSAQKEVEKEPTKSERKMHVTDLLKWLKNYQVGSIGLKKSAKRLLLFGVIVFVITQGAKMALEQMTSSEEVVVEEQQDPSWQELVEEGKYEQAASLYPDQYPQLMDFLVDKQEFSWVEKLNEQKATGNATFDLAFRHEDWETVIVTHVEQLTEKRQIKLAIAYLELEQVQEATVLNRHLNHPEITLALDQFYLQESLNLLREKEVEKAKEQSKKIQTEELQLIIAAYLEQATIILDFIRLYESSNTYELIHLWEERLARLGEVD